MHRLIRSLILVGLAAVAALTAGFYIFAGSIRGYVAHVRPTADAVVVLTGGEDRIAAGVDLVAAGRGARLLISGVHRANSTARDLARKLGGDERIYNCCVDLGHGARDTIGNAREAKEWADQWGFRSLIIVTSAYHMPRSMIEFTGSMPGVAIYAYPVGSRHFRIGEWWHHYPTARLLAGEYVKYLAALARSSFARVLAMFDASETPPRRPAIAQPRSAPF